MRRSPTPVIEIVDVAISDLKPAEYNPRQLTKKQGDDLKKSLIEFGFVDPAIVNANPDRKNIIIGGHQRIECWRQLGHKEVPVVYLTLKEAKERELNIRLNRNSGEWDWDKLANEFEMDDLLAWGFVEKEFASIDINFDQEKIIDTDIPTYSCCPSCGYKW
mgnify:CR=1 FL=1